MCVRVLPASIYVYPVDVLRFRGQKRVLDPLELELNVIVSHHSGAGNGTWVLCKSKCSSWAQ